MTAGSGSDNIYAPQRLQLLGTDADLVKFYGTLFERDARLNGVAQTLRLVEDFLNHVMRKSALSAILFSPKCTDAQIPPPRTIVFLTSPFGPSTTRSAGAPSFTTPCLFKPATRAGFTVAKRSAFCRSQWAYCITLRRARSIVRMLPASFPSMRDLPSFTSTSQEPRR